MADSLCQKVGPLSTYFALVPIYRKKTKDYDAAMMKMTEVIQEMRKEMKTMASDIAKVSDSDLDGGESVRAEKTTSTRARGSTTEGRGKEDAEQGDR